MYTKKNIYFIGVIIVFVNHVILVSFTGIMTEIIIIITIIVSMIIIITISIIAIIIITATAILITEGFLDILK